MFHFQQSLLGLLKMMTLSLELWFYLQAIHNHIDPILRHPPLLPFPCCCTPPLFP